jgi:Zn-dependent protease
MIITKILSSFFKLFGLVKLIKPLASAGTIIFSIVVYSMAYGMPYALGFIGLILVHELGHYAAARYKNIAVGLPTFIPFIGAWVELDDQEIDPEVKAYIAFAGPFVGTLASFAMYYVWANTGMGIFVALAQSGFILNLFNLIPIPRLDGGHIIAIISPRLWFLGIPILLYLWWDYDIIMALVIAIIAIPQLWDYWENGENSELPQIANSMKFEYAVLYVVLIIILCLMIIEV